MEEAVIVFNESIMKIRIKGNSIRYRLTSLKWNLCGKVILWGEKEFKNQIFLNMN